MKKTILVFVRRITLLLVGMGLGLSVAHANSGQPDGAETQVLLNNVNIFNGTDKKLLNNRNVLIEGDIIKHISSQPINAAKAAVINGSGRTLMPGLIDAHWHTSLAALPPMALFNGHMSYIHILSGKEAEATLMRGVTTVRDLAGPSFGLKLAIDQGLVSGPRIYPAGALISQTSGHGDMRRPNERHHHFGGEQTYFAMENFGLVADGVAEVQAAVREQLRLGASHIKLAAGGGVGSPSDPIDVTQYSLEELKAAVGAAEDWGTYVTVHAYTPRAVQRAIEAGVKVIEHGQLLDEETIKIMASKGVWLSLQPFLDCSQLTTPNPLNPNLHVKAQLVCSGTAKVYELSKKYQKLKVAWGTDLLGSAKNSARQVEMLATLKTFYTPYELLKMATSTNAELLKLSGPRNPYPKPLGVVEEGAYADLLLVDGNPTEDIDLLVDQDKLAMIMKGGKIYKNTISTQ